MAASCWLLVIPLWFLVVPLATGLKFETVSDFEVSRGAPAGTVVGRLKVSSGLDGSGGMDDSVVFSLHNSSDHAHFKLDTQTGLLSTTRPIEREVNATYHIIARATSIKEKTSEHGRFVIRVTEPAKLSDPAQLGFDQVHYRGVVEAGSPAGLAVMSTMALLVRNGTTSNANITYFIEANDLALTWLTMDSQTGKISLRKDVGFNFEPLNFNLTVGARTASPVLVARANASVTIHGLPRPRELTVAKLSADEAVVCWKFPVSAAAQGYRLRYWPANSSNAGNDDNASSSSVPQVAQTAPAELKIAETNAAKWTNHTNEADDLRNICAHLKMLGAEAAYEVQVSAYLTRSNCTKQSLLPGDVDDDVIGPASAKLHFTTKENLCLVSTTCGAGECQLSLEPPGYECLCHSGHFGSRCQHFDLCVLNPCHNGATCVSRVRETNSSSPSVVADDVGVRKDAFRCICSESWTGENCSLPASCPGRPCLNNGTCIGHKCVCQAGYEGSQCQDFNPCWAEPCQNGATCSKSTDANDYNCTCLLGYRGLDCGEAIDYCALEPCRNGGLCTSRDGSYHCLCPKGFRGVGCEQDLDECLSDPCRKGSTCLNTPGSFLCICPPGWTGSTCNDEVMGCSSSPCQNRAVCKNESLGNYTCICRPGFTGRDCQIDIDDCDPDPCLNGGTCLDGINAFTCNCPPAYEGLRCDYEKMCPTEKEVVGLHGTFHWPAIEPGRTAALECPYGPIRSLQDFKSGRKQNYPTRLESYERRQERLKYDENNGLIHAVRSCEVQPDGTVHWMESDVSLCREQDSAQAESKSSALEELTVKENLTPILLDQMAEQVVDLVDFAVDDPVVAQSMFNSLSNVLNQADEDVLVASSESCEKILEAVERYASNVQLTPGQSVQVATPNIALEAVLLNTSSAAESYSFRPSFADPISVSITVPKEAMEGSSPDGRPVRLKFISYRNGKLFQPRSGNHSVVIAGATPSNAYPSIVLVASVGDKSVTGLTHPVTYSMPLETSSFFYSCVYWDEIEKDWSTSGIKTRWAASSGTIECESDHLTAFSVLLDPTPHERLADIHEYILKLISYVGSGLSILGLTITVLLYSLFRNLRRDRGGKILLNLCISLLLLNVVFLISAILGSVRQEDEADGMAESRVWVAGRQDQHEEAGVNQAHVDVCAGLSITLHYLVLSSLGWMLVEAVHMYQLLITVFANSETFFMLKRIIAAWGAPLLVVVPVAVLRMDYYYDTSGQTCGRMSALQPIIYYGAFLGPSCLILLINTVVFFLVLRVILMQGQRGRAVGKVPAHSESTSSSGGHNGMANGGLGGSARRLVSMAQLRGAVTVMALLGVTWLAGALAIGPVKLVMTYLFCVCNSLQGFVIFLVRVVQYPEARLSWITLWNTGQTHIPYDVTRHSSGPTTNSSGSNGNHHSVHHNGPSGSVKSGRNTSHKNLSVRCSNSVRTRSPGVTLANGHKAAGQNDSLTPSQAPTLPMPNETNGSLTLSYQHWFRSSAKSRDNQSSNTASPSSHGSSQSRLRRIFGQLGLIDHTSFRLSGKSSDSAKRKAAQHALLERHVSGATNPPPSPGAIEKDPAHHITVAPEDLVKPNFMIGEEISLLHRNGSLPSLDLKETWTSNVGREGANTSWTFLRPDFNEMCDPNLQSYLPGKGSVPTLLQKPDESVPARRTASFIVDRTRSAVDDDLCFTPRQRPVSLTRDD